MEHTRKTRGFLSNETSKFKIISLFYIHWECGFDSKTREKTSRWLFLTLWFWYVSSDYRVATIHNFKLAFVKNVINERMKLLELINSVLSKPTANYLWFEIVCKKKAWINCRKSKYILKQTIYNYVMYNNDRPMW